MQVNSSSAMYAMNVYRNQVSNVSKMKVNTANTSADIKVVHNTNANAQIKSNEIEPKNNFIPSKQLKSNDASIARVQKDIFSPEDNAIKSSLQTILGVNDFHTRVKKIVHHKEAFAENMYSLLKESDLGQRDLELEQNSIIRKSLYA
jgi:hypothetical protein